ncbi:hypothetical protein P43SY_001291 [Pythium insidiosum]|uniref:Uncharacterized protein n=1 Tax=Pythium insidiosum TaxID=114742 RepID=A0AAD5LKH8_PYTIN|nr:hypothetical protein P43SY_001291 [Pythium insidiosum]
MAAVGAMARAACARRRGLLLLLLAASIAAAIVYELTAGGKPRRFVYDDPRLNQLDLRGDRPATTWRDGEFECLGWRATHGCDPHGPRDPSRDRPCDAPLPRVSGYCEVRNRTSGAVHRVMLSTCKSWQWWLVERRVNCNQARLFTDFALRAASYRHAVAPPRAASPELARGIGMIAYPKVIAGVYAIVRLLRAHGCALPVELWIDPLEMSERHSVLQALQREHNVVVRTIADPAATQFHAKPYAVFHSRFESVLFLDSDNLPTRDPTYLFDTPEFRTHGALFWPDFWRPTPDTPFNVHEQSALWPLLDMPFVDMFEQESGQLLVNRSRSSAALHKLLFFSAQLPRVLTDWQLVYGDKDLFRLAWLNTSTPFYFVPHLVALGGRWDPDSGFFCGVAMVQRDPRGDIIFLHRNQAKLSGRRDQQRVITHLQKFIGGDGDATSLRKDLDKYRVQCKMRRLGQNSCFLLNPVAPDGSPTPLLVQSLDGTKYPQTERQAIHFSIEGRHLMTAAEEAEVAALEDKQRRKEQQAADSAREAARRAGRQFYLLVGLALLATGAALVARCGCCCRGRRTLKGTRQAARSGGATGHLAAAAAYGDVVLRRKISTHVGVDEEDPHIL